MHCVYFTHTHMDAHKCKHIYNIIIHKYTQLHNTQTHTKHQFAYQYKWSTRLYTLATRAPRLHWAHTPAQPTYFAAQTTTLACCLSYIADHAQRRCYKVCSNRYKLRTYVCTTAAHPTHTHASRPLQGGDRAVRVHIDRTLISAPALPAATAYRDRDTHL